MSTFKITYDRADALVEIAEETDLGGIEKFRATLDTAAKILSLDAAILYDVETRILNALQDGRLRSITLEV